MSALAMSTNVSNRSVHSLLAATLLDVTLNMGNDGGLDFGRFNEQYFELELIRLR